MDEPSILDYVKSKIFFWRGESITIPEATPDPDFYGDVTPKAGTQPITEPDPSAITPLDDTAPAEKSPSELAWMRVLGLSSPLVLAWLGQRALEPPGRSIASGIVLYLLAGITLVLLNLRGELKISEQPAAGLQSDPMTVRSYALWACIPLVLAAFWAFGGNRFTGLNICLWLLALLSFLRAFWLPESSIPVWIERFRSGWEKFRSQGIRFSPWTLVVLAAFAFSAFFRFYQLDLVPKEMFSDHAEKLLDVADVLVGQTSIFFPRNTGREAFQMYLTAAMALIFGTGLSFMSLKLGTVFAGLFTLPFIYLMGKEVANRRVGLWAMVFAGIAYWPNVISRVALRFTLYPFFAAPTLYFMVRGLRRRRRNDFILAGIFLGLGLHGYSPFRLVPLVVLAAVGLYLLHKPFQGGRKQTLWALLLLVCVSLIFFVPLLRYWLSDPGMFSYRAMTRMTGVEQALEEPAIIIFFKNLWKSLIMPFWDNGEIWVHSVTHRPALDVISAALFFIGSLLLIVRYIRSRNWLDIFLLVSIPLLMLPSVLSLAFPAENPSLNRTGGALIPIFLIVGIALDGFLTSLKSRLKGAWGTRFAWGLGILLLLFSSLQNYDLVFNQYRTQFDLSAWNTSELGAVIRQFADSVGAEDSAWVIPYPYWVDTRLVGIRAGFPDRDYALWAEDLDVTLSDPRVKLFLFKPEDTEALARLQDLYPAGVMSLYQSDLPGKDFDIYFVPPER
jgi:4-amino-4-deoxy-L-arabinose transferase-like glycosyltransferase